jgi:hypothetical protein
MDKRFGTWKTRSLYGSGSLMTASTELFRYRLDFAGMHEVRWEGSGKALAGEYTFFYGKGNRTMNWVQVFSVHKRIISAVKRAEFVSDRKSYLILRGC